MPNKMFVLNNHHHYTQQPQKIQISNRPYDQLLVNQKSSKIQITIFQKIAQVQSENRRLLDLINRLNSSHITLGINESLPQAVDLIQKQMKSAFNSLIQSIQEFFIDIDNKLKSIGAYLASLSGIDPLQTSNKDKDKRKFPISTNKQIGKQISKQIGKYSSTYQQQSIRIINLKIQNLQKDLDQTKSNENKLIKIIQKLVQKYELNNEVTIIKQDSYLNKKLQMIEGQAQNHEQKKSNHCVTNLVKKLNLQRIVTQNHSQNDNSLCEELTKLEEHDSVQKQISAFNQNVRTFDNTKCKPIISKAIQSSAIRLNSNELSNSIVGSSQQNQCFIKKLYSRKTPSLSKISLKSCNPQKNSIYHYRKLDDVSIDQSNKTHRQAYLRAQLSRWK